MAVIAYEMRFRKPNSVIKYHFSYPSYTRSSALSSITSSRIYILFDKIEVSLRKMRGYHSIDHQPIWVSVLRRVGDRFVAPFIAFLGLT